METKEGRKKDEHRSIHSAAHLGLREEGRVLHLHPLRVDLGWLRVKLTANLVLAGARDVLHTGGGTHTARPGNVNQANSCSFIQFVKVDSCRRKFCLFGAPRTDLASFSLSKLIAVDISYVCLVPPPPHPSRTYLASFSLSKLIAVDISSLCLVPPVPI